MKRAFLLVLAGWLLAAGMALGKITSPLEHFGFAIGDDYQLATYTQTETYFKKLAAESDRVQLVDIGQTEEGRTQWMLVISAPENLAAMARYKEIAAMLARAEIDEDHARILANEGRAVVWIDGGLHASETASTHQLIETAWQLASATDEETARILRDTIVLCVHANPDGQELVTNWYLREPVPARRTLTPTPRAYQKYIGHDNNRDFFLSAMKETTNINRQLYLEWFPQIVYNHHQTAPVGTTIFTPPFRDPFNYVFDPLVVNGVQALGTAIQGRLLQEGKPGATSRSGADYSTWFNGSLRTTSYFHNMIGLLTEVVGGPTPMQLPLVARRQLPSSDLPAPVEPQLWRFRQSIEYSVSANRAVLDYASRHREVLLYNIYRMGRNAIERGSRDHWTPRPSRIEEIEHLASQERGILFANDGGEAGGVATAGSPLGPRYWQLLHRPEWRDPRGFIIPADQADFPTAVKFVNALMKTGVAVHRATADFVVAGKPYPAGSYIVKCAQAFRPHVLDMFEPQDHPNDFRSAGGLPNKPYDVAGWTLAFQMGVVFDRVLEGFDGPFQRLPFGELQQPPPGRVAADSRAAGFLTSHRVNDSAILVNRLLKAGAPVFRLKHSPARDSEFGPGAIYIPDRAPARQIVEQAAAQLGLKFRSVGVEPRPSERLQLRPVRIALWDRFGGSQPAGWTRWLLEQFEFPFQVVYAPEIDARKLREKFDAIVFVSGAIPPAGTRPPPENRPRNLPPEFEAHLGQITPEKSVPALKEFLEAGGTVVTIGSSTHLAYHLGLPLQSALTERNEDGRLRNLPEDKFFVPGSILEMRVDHAHPVAWGMPSRADVYFERSAAFALPGSVSGGEVFERIAWFDSERPLRSGWAWGQNHLNNSTALAVAKVGAGRLYLFGSEVAFRAQTHGTFKLLFNALHLGAAMDEPALP